MSLNDQRSRPLLSYMRDNDVYSHGHSVDMAAFKYTETLSSSQLRLLRPTNLGEDRLAFATGVFERSEAPMYTAISYTWGDEEASESITLDGKPFKVRTNLWSALHYIGRASYSQPWRYIWVDAICINQGSTAERNAQVRFMDQTYSKASMVSAWLGLPSLPEHIHMPRKHSPLKTVSIDPFTWVDQIEDLANRPYWTRYWVIQEYRLARDLRVYCSDTSMDWDQFGDLVQRRTDAQGPQPTLLFSALPLVQGREATAPQETLLDLLRKHHRSQCKDPRDRIFALIGLLTDWERDLLSRVFPDYSLSVDVVRVIALAHAMNLYLVIVSIESELFADDEELFLGLGVSEIDDRRRLLRVAKKLDYSTPFCPERVTDLLEEDADHEPPKGVEWSHITGKWMRRALMLIGLITLGFYLWWRRDSK